MEFNDTRRSVLWPSCINPRLETLIISAIALWNTPQAFFKIGGHTCLDHPLSQKIDYSPGISPRLAHERNVDLSGVLAIHE